MKILVTGGTGFIGSRLALRVRGEGHDVVVAGQLNSDAERARAAELERAGVVIHQGPLQDAGYAQSIAAAARPSFIWRLRSTKRMSRTSISTMSMYAGPRLCSRRAGRPGYGDSSTAAPSASTASPTARRWMNNPRRGP